MSNVDDKAKQRFFSNQGDVMLKLIGSNLARFQLIREFIHVHLICKFQEEPIKAEILTQMTKLNKGFFQQ